MAGVTAIGWCDSTLNCFEWHCEGISPGCDNCYARVMADRWHGAGYFESAAPSVKLHRLLLPFSDPEFRDGLRIFLASMSDPFHSRLPVADLALVFAMMAADQRHIYQVLTKRQGVMKSRLTQPGWPDLVREGLERLEVIAGSKKRLTPWRREVLAGIEQAQSRRPFLPLPNVMLGVSAEDRKRYKVRTRTLRETPAAARFVSAEPLLGDLGEIDLRGIDWLIAGGESGRGHRPMDLGWLDSLVSQCRDADVATWTKQDSGLLPGQQGRIPARLWIHDHCGLALAA